jgi:hypothetical protein
MHVLGLMIFVCLFHHADVPLGYLCLYFDLVAHGRVVRRFYLGLVHFDYRSSYSLFSNLVSVSTPNSFLQFL